MSFPSNLLTGAALAYIGAGVLVNSTLLYNKTQIFAARDTKENKCKELIGPGKTPLGDRNAILVCDTAFHNIDTSYRTNMEYENSHVQCRNCQRVDAKVALLQQQTDTLSAYNPFWPTAIFKKIFG